MASWKDLTETDPELAAFGRMLFERFGMAYLATVRKDGGPRVHPVSPSIVQERLYIGIRIDSPKRFDLSRDARYMLHALPGPDNAEFWLRGRVIQVNSLKRTEVVNASDGSIILPDTTVLFELDIEQVYSTTYDRADQQEFRPTRKTWEASKQSVLHI